MSAISKLSSTGRVPEEIRQASGQQKRFDQDNTENTVGYVMLDCSGTTMDRYVDAPAIVFVAVFKKYGLEISLDEARKPMGLRKDLHIKALTEIPSVRQRFTAKFGREPTQADVDKMFAVFVPTQIDLLKSGNYHELLPGTAEVVHKMQKDGIRIGVTTGFTRDMLDILPAGAAKQGFNPGREEPRAFGRVQPQERDAPHRQSGRHRLRRRRGCAAVLASGRIEMEQLRRRQLGRGEVAECRTAGGAGTSFEREVDRRKRCALRDRRSAGLAGRDRRNQSAAGARREPGLIVTRL